MVCEKIVVLGLFVRPYDRQVCASSDGVMMLLLIEEAVAIAVLLGPVAAIAAVVSRGLAHISHTKSLVELAYVQMEQFHCVVVAVAAAIFI